MLSCSNNNMNDQLNYNLHPHLVIVWYPPLRIEEEGSGDIRKQRTCKWNTIKAESTMYFAIFLCGNANRTYVITK